MVTTPQMENHTDLEWRDHTDSTLSQPKGNTRTVPNRSKELETLLISPFKPPFLVDFPHVFPICSFVFGGLPPCFPNILGVPLKPVKMQPHLASARSDELLTSHTAAAMESKDGRAPSTTK